MIFSVFHSIGMKNLYNVLIKEILLSCVILNDIFEQASLCSDWDVYNFFLFIITIIVLLESFFIVFAHVCCHVILLYLSRWYFSHWPTDHPCMLTVYLYACWLCTCTHADCVPVRMLTVHLYACWLCTCTHADCVPVRMLTVYLYACWLCTCTHADCGVLQDACWLPVHVLTAACCKTNADYL